MADRAVAWKGEFDVRWIVAIEIVGCVAGVALRGCPLEHIIDVAGHAGKRRMRAAQWIAGVLQMIEFGVEPAVH